VLSILTWPNQCNHFSVNTSRVPLLSLKIYFIIDSEWWADNWQGKTKDLMWKTCLSSTFCTTLPHELFCDLASTVRRWRATYGIAVCMSMPYQMLMMIIKCSTSRWTFRDKGPR
jgi:hypothetical protein